MQQSKQSPILEKKERENAGAMASNRFSYQVNWGVCKLIQLHKKNDSYFLLMEKHDDALICDSIINPKYMEFYQIKTKKGKNWRLQSLITSYTSKNSIISKMYDSYEKFGSTVKMLGFRTNSYFELKENSNDKTYTLFDQFTIIQLNKEDQLKFIDSLRKDYPSASDEELKKIFSFKKEIMNVDNHTETAIAELSKYFDLELDKPFRSSLTYSFIAGEVLMKNNFEGSIFTTEELEKLKSISNKDFSNWINHCIKNTKSKDSIIEDMNQELLNSNISFRDRKSYKQNALSYSIELKTQTQIFKKFKQFVKEAESSCNGETLLNSAYDIYNLIESKIEQLNHYSKDFIISAIMYELCQ